MEKMLRAGLNAGCRPRNARSYGIDPSVPSAALASELSNRAPDRVSIHAAAAEAF